MVIYFTYNLLVRPLVYDKIYACDIFCVTTNKNNMHNAPELWVRAGILLSCGKHLHVRIISVMGEFWVQSKKKLTS